ncbi:MAG: Cof-type HAD-IIB family hydrolase [Streptococcaceae bacterium]|jgi:Cof subfamily protein (haloacid dehalogenase superfamily)|nr:Cof-type HAD-IIB family hydrolase [Streptococcaceae bacterium]
MRKIKKIFATDMDGTFLRNDHAYDAERFRKLLDKFDATEALFCAASGRQLLALEELFAEFKDKISFVAENGGVVSIGDEIISAVAFDKAQMEELLRALQFMPSSPREDFMISGLKGAYAPLTVSQSYFDFIQDYYAKCEKVSSMSKIDDVMLKISTHFPQECIFECADWINEHVSFARATTSGYQAVDIIPKGISKATGLDVLAKHFDLTAENVVAFGDQMNDFEMLQYAGKAVAVENAVDDLKAVADYTIGRNVDSSVLAEMERLVR